jgi:hypothetical protein
MELKLKRLYPGLLVCLVVLLAVGSLLLLLWGCDRTNSQTQEPGVALENPVVASTLGLSDHQLVEDLINQGVEAVHGEDLKKSMSLFSSEYGDGLDFNVVIMRKLIKRAYRKFDEPRIFFKEPPAITIYGSKAIVQAMVKLSVEYSGKRNYILGDSKTHNSVIIRLNKQTNGWKIKSIEGLRPLGFEEGILRHLGDDLGLVLTTAEREANRRFCMPCRIRMNERFSTGN